MVCGVGYPNLTEFIGEETAMNILITMHECEEKGIYFPQNTIDGFKKLGNVIMNNSNKPFTEEDLIRNIRDVDVCG